MPALTETKTYHGFILTLDGVSEVTDELQGALLQAGCDDALLWGRGETVYLSFRREADSLLDAVASASADVGRAGVGLRVVHVAVDPDGAKT